ncbi:hypothetical protein BV898_04573 [Hypsibius exemplaris]|uniref:RAD3-like helicase DEAD domain-containing protein n=1 Tax=Hypsibius exemplaris TaxID=2072580 RepID=A0A1W0X1M2_HYPEX|nr:hypothetical protein BV898_04573 [Hypsibius exemplaris]
MAHHRTVIIDTVPVYLPADSDASINYVAESLIRPLQSGNSYSCSELFDQSYQTRIQVPVFEDITIAAFGDPANMCINKNIQGKLKEASNSEKNAACRATVRCGRCPFYNNVFNIVAGIDLPVLSAFLPDLEDFSIKMDKANICPYYAALSRMSTADVVVTTYEALKGTLNGQRLPKERLVLDRDTYLVCDDPFAMEQMLEDCYNFALSVSALQRVITLSVERKRFLWEKQLNLLPEPSQVKHDFYSSLGCFCEILDKVGHVLTGRIPFSPETPKGRLKLLADLGLQKVSPKVLLELLTLLRADVFDVGRLQTRQRSTLIQDLQNVQQFLTNLTDPDVSHCLFSGESAGKNPFHFWPDRPEGVPDAEIDVATLNFKFFGVSVNPAIAALRRRGVGVLLTFGTMVPLSFAAIEPIGSFRILRLPYFESLRQSLSRTVFSGIFAFGPDDVPFLSASVQRETPRYILALGRSIRRIFEAMLPDKVLILFPSMTYYESCSAVWKADNTLDQFTDGLRLVQNCGGQNCTICVGHMAFWQRHSQHVVTFARGAALDGICGGFQAVVAVALPYQFVGDNKITMKKSSLKAFKAAAFHFYTQEAVNAAASPWIRATCLDPSSVYRGRVYIALDSRFTSHKQFLPHSLQQGMKEYTTFNEGMRQLTEFLRRIQPWDITTGGDAIDPDVLSHIRLLHRSVQFDHVQGAKIDVVNRLFDLIEQFRTDENIDLLATGVVDAIHVEQQFEGWEFSVYFLPWLMGFGQYFLRSAQQRYWPVVVQNLLKQVGDRIAEDPNRSWPNFTLDADVTSPHRRCHVQ